MDLRAPLVRDIWSRVFNGGMAPLTAWDLKEKYGKQGKKLCFKNLGIGIYGPASPMTVSASSTTCSHTALVRGYSDFVIRGLNLQQLTHYAQPSPSKEVVITWMARRASVEWPEKRFCSDTDNFFHCKHWAHLGMRTLGRMVKNDAAVSNDFATRYAQPSSRTCLEYNMCCTYPFFSAGCCWLARARANIVPERCASEGARCGLQSADIRGADQGGPSNRYYGM